jgi:Bifunctional DNA primase/polymerase, N-terminal
VRNTFASHDNHAAQAAIRYVEIGLTPVPLRSNSKAPYLGSWPTLKLRTLLKRFRPDDNIGLRLGLQDTGKMIIAIDVDAKSGQKGTLLDLLVF